MTEIIGYGEDSCTYWVFRYGLPMLLEKLNDNSTSEECRIFYRPSLGRGGGIGEFDAILSTKKAIYLIESKWEHSEEYRRGRFTQGKHSVELKGNQIKTHTEFTRFLNGSAFQKKIGQNTRLYKNLKYLLAQLPLRGREIKSIILFFTQEAELGDSSIMLGKNTSEAFARLIPIAIPRDSRERRSEADAGLGFVKL